MDKPDHLTYEDIADELYTAYPRYLEQTDILVVRPPIDRMLTHPLHEPSGVSAMVDRAPRASLHLLYSHDFKIHVSANLNDRVEDKLAIAAPAEVVSRGWWKLVEVA